MYMYGEGVLKDRQCRNWFDEFRSGDSKSTIDRHIQRLGLVKKLDTWIPHKLKEVHLTKRSNACDLHL